MTVQQDLQKAIASAMSLQGSYAMFAESTQDPMTKDMFNRFKQEMQTQVQQLQGRLQYLNQMNQLNQQQAQQQPTPAPPQQ